MNRSETMARSFNSPDVQSISSPRQSKGTINPKILQKIRQQEKCEMIKKIQDSNSTFIPLKKKDPSWELFGIIKINEVNVMKDHIFCKLCYEDGILRKYKNSSSLSVLKLHLENEHNQNTKNVRMKNVPSILLGELTEGISQKEQLLLRVSLYIVMSLRPFSDVENPYFIDLLIYSNVIESADEVPKASAVKNTGLDRIYNFVTRGMKELLLHSPDYIVILFDCWQDCTRRSFLNVIVSFIDEKFNPVRLMIAFRKLFYKDAETEKTIVLSALEAFGLKHKKLIGISDRGSDMIKLSKILKMQRIDCTAHGLHNLITRDVLPRVKPVEAVLVKLREITSVLRYRSNDLRTDFNLEASHAALKILKQISDLGEF